MMPLKLPASYIKAQWPVPSHVSACVTTRLDGKSLTPFNGFNLAHHVGDSWKHVEENRNRLNWDLALKEAPIWLEQVHRTDVVNIDTVQPGGAVIQADASFTSQTGKACVVMTADCLPVLFSNKTGTWVAAVHAGWRGLVDGILQNTIDQYQGNSEELVAWLGPAISQRHFEVGADVKSAFVNVDKEHAEAFIEKDNKKFMCDMYNIAERILRCHHIEAYGGDYCTYTDDSRFYSYRKSTRTGRMASLIWIEKEIIGTR